MATNGKDAALRKKKGFSSLAPPHIAVPLGRRTPDRDFLAESDKPSPNYLKPTLSSGLEVCKQGKKQCPEDTSSLKHFRRRSLEKLPSPSHVQRTPPLGSPKERTLKPLSPSPISQKPISDITSKTHRWGKARQLLANPRTIKKSTNTSTKKEPKATNTPKTRSGADITEPIYIKAEEELSVQEAAKEDITKVESQEILIKILPEQDEISTHLVVSESKIPEYEKHIICNPSTFSEDQEAVIALQIEDAKEKRIDNNQEDEKHGKKDEDKNESRDCSDHSEESLAGKPIETKNHNIGKGKAISAEDSGEENSSIVLSEKEDLEGGSQRLKFKERVDVEGIEEPKSEPVVLKRHDVKGKKEATVYNDVIEETASKLVEKRKSKVKALVGAFETVISLQEPEVQQCQQACGNEEDKAVTEEFSS